MKLIGIRKSIVLSVCVIVLLGTILGLFCGTVAAYTTSPIGKTVVIDAGHGGMDAGVVGRQTSVKESDINLAIAKELRGFFVDAGFGVVMTRNTNGGLYGLPTRGFKMRDMKKRKKIIEESAADMVISVHQNSCTSPSRRGGTVFYDMDSACGKALAECIQSSINGMDECVRKNSALIGDYYMLKCTSMPSVIVECGFMTNADDEKILSTPKYQKKIAYAIFLGAIKYYS